VIYLPVLLSVITEHRMSAGGEGVQHAAAETGFITVSTAAAAAAAAHTPVTVIS